MVSIDRLASGVGSLARIMLILLYTSGVMRLSTSKAFKFSITCSGFVAPIITVLV